MKVYLVENAVQVRDRLHTLIADVRGVEIVGEAASAPAAVQGILATGADLVVLDIHLDGGNGFDVLRALQKQAPSVATYVLSNFPSDTYRSVAKRLGARGFFDKSRELDRLIGAIGAHAAA